MNEVLSLSMTIFYVGWLFLVTLLALGGYRG